LFVLFREPSGQTEFLCGRFFFCFFIGLIGGLLFLSLEGFETGLGFFESSCGFLLDGL
jgi:hypothetical protein